MKLHHLGFFLLLIALCLPASAQPPLPVPSPAGTHTIDDGIYTQIMLETDGASNYDTWLGFTTIFTGTGSNRMLAAGAPNFRYRDEENQTGGVIFYHKVDGRWVVKSILTDTHNPLPPYGDSFGEAIAMTSPETPALLAVGAPLRDVSGVVNAGTVYIYRYENNGWVEEAALIPPVPSDNLIFGSALALTGTGDGATLLVGAPNDDPAGATDAGSVLVYTRSGTTWSQQQQLTDGENRSGTRFGTSISAVGTGDSIAAIIGASGDNEQYSYQGTATIFGRAGNVWTPEHHFEIPSLGNRFDFYGVKTAAIEHNGVMRLALASLNPPPNPCSVMCQGRVDIFTRSGSTWVHESLEHEYAVGQSVALVSFGGDLYLLTGGKYYAHMFRETVDGWGDVRVFTNQYGYGDFSRSIAAAGDDALLIAIGAQLHVGNILIHEPFSSLAITSYQPLELTEDLTSPVQLGVSTYGMPSLITLGVPNNATLTITPDANCDLGQGAGMPVTQWLDQTGTNYIDVLAVDDPVIEGPHQCTVSTLLWFSNSPSRFTGDSVSLLINDDDYPSFLVNGSFEQGLAGWTILNKTKDKVRYADDDAYDDNYWMTFQRSAQENTILRQVVKDFKGIAFTTGMKVRLQFRLHTISAPYGKFEVKLKISYSDGTKATKVKRSFGDNSANFFTMIDAILASPNIAKMKVDFRHGFQEKRILWPTWSYLDHVILTLPDAGLNWRTAGQ